jgi:molybdate transport system permease protein
LAAPGIVAGRILGCAKALGEFGATITFVSNIPGETQTLALAIFNLVETPGADAPLMRLLWLSVGVSFLALMTSELLAQRVRRDRP